MKKLRFSVAMLALLAEVHEQLGLPAPPRMEGRPMTFARSGGTEAERVSWLVDTNAAAQFRDGRIGSVVLWFVILDMVRVCVRRLRGLRLRSSSEAPYQLSRLQSATAQAQP